MGENGKQAQERVIQEVSEYLARGETLPLFRGQINVKQLAKNAGVQRKNFYDVTSVVEAVNKLAVKQGVPPLPLPVEREELAKSSPGDVQKDAKSEDMRSLERTIASLEKRLVGLNNQVKELEDEKENLESKNKSLQNEINRLLRQQFLDELALEGRPVRDSAREQ